MTHRRLFWDIVEKIEQLIDSGEYALASRLPPERVLAERFGVSRPTIREAIIALEVRGRVIVKTSSGVYVTNGHSKDYGNCDISAFELTQARALVEGEAAALAASSISSTELDNLEQALTRMALGDNAEEADKEFHRIISKATRNGAILAMVEKFWHLRDTRKNILRAYSNVCSSSFEQRIEEHDAILKALREKDAESARMAMHQHFNRLINALFDANEAQMLEEIKRKNSETRGLYSLKHLTHHH